MDKANNRGAHLLGMAISIVKVFLLKKLSGHFISTNLRKGGKLAVSRGNKCQIWQIFVEALEEFPNYFIQSKTCASAHEHSVTKYFMLLSNFWDKNRRLNHFSEK